MTVIAAAWNAVGGIASVVAALGALTTILYARSTVKETVQAREQSHVQHLEAIAEQRAAARTFANAHDEEMAERERTRAAEIRLQRIVEMSTISQLLLDLVDTARAEHTEPPPRIAPPMPFRATRIPALLIRLKIAIGVLEALGGPALPRASQLADLGYGPGSNSMQIVGDGVSALQEIDHVVHTSGHLVESTS